MKGEGFLLCPALVTLRNNLVPNAGQGSFRAPRSLKTRDKRREREREKEKEEDRDQDVKTRVLYKLK